MSKEQNFKSNSAQDTIKHGRNFSKKIKKFPCLILLEGVVGAGKTHWSKGFIEGFLGKETVVTSPTYSLVNGYKKGKATVYHVDLFRLRDAMDLESIGFWDLLSGRNVVVVEWGNMLPPQWPKELEVFKIYFKVNSENERELDLSLP